MKVTGAMIPCQAPIQKLAGSPCAQFASSSGVAVQALNSTTPASKKRICIFFMKNVFPQRLVSHTKSQNAEYI